MRRLMWVVGMMLLLTVLGSPLASVQAQGQQGGVVTASALNVRAGAGTGYAVLGSLAYGAPVQILATSADKGWYQIQYRSGSAWVSARYVRLTAATAAAPTTGTAASGAVAPAVAGKIVFALQPDGALYTVNADGSGLRQLGVGQDPAWSPTGDRIAYTTWVGEAPGLYLMQADGTGRERLVGGQQLKAPSWSPDGKHIAFAGQNGGQLTDEEECWFSYCFTTSADPHWRLGMVNMSTRSASGLPDDYHSISPVWLSNNQVLFDGEPGLKTVYTDRSDTPITFNRDVRLHDPRICRATGAMALTYFQHDHWEVYTLNANGAGLRRLTTLNLLNPTPPAQNVSPSWSPDCSQILFLSNRDGGRWRPYIMAADGSNQRPYLPTVFDALTFSYNFSQDRVFDWR